MGVYNNMKKIAFILPYFGKLPKKGFELWLLSCKYNPTIDWLIYTDDKTEFQYPQNVKLTYTTLSEIKKKAQSLFEFQISLDKPRKLCDFKPAYGEIFKEELKEYDFWGYCDLDLVWGNIRTFITDKVLEEYERIGFQGHALLYKNTPEVIARYKTIVSNHIDYKKIFSDPGEFVFDENGMDEIYNYLHIPYFNQTIFAHLRKYEYGFFLGHLPKTDDYKNKYQIFLWNDGKILRKYVFNHKIYTEEFMYIHFFCRPIQFKFSSCKGDDTFIMYPDVVDNYRKQLETIDEKLIKKYGKSSAVHYYATSIWHNRKKITPKRVLKNIKNMINYNAKR